VGFWQMFHVEQSQERLLRKHLEWVLNTTRIHNLTAIIDADEAWRLHVIDSLAALSGVDEAPPGPLLDIGTGGGFPGVPLAVMSGRETVCLDSVKKKIQVLKEFLRSDAGYHNIRTCDQRAEERAIDEPNAYAVVTTRAVSQLNSIVELAAPLLMEGGICICLKGNVTPEEIAAGDAAAHRCGLERKQIRNYTLPGGHEARCIVEYLKVAEPEITLPRRTGVAQKRPLQ